MQRRNDKGGAYDAQGGVIAVGGIEGGGIEGGGIESGGIENGIVRWWRGWLAEQWRDSAVK
ncbi:MAG: hypothetical protein LKF49_01485 [Bifidobacterium tibiigranuli]|jgi:hypothetical protein|uniref:hypothetical protein n=1 Tax=Bifidobacterium tibiigranuli TaxID=2172043 RepID=UPI0023564E99|nr:hypothetical protein [Bifidobacterium tibiigranuli]MCH3975120.1 hypothetical protein [Bifidobacterium tibiigranuli]MCH4190316.1 hypothetical protein [Bifidobacterium tibiigranuli]MCH4202878.1 hypothetical protein [Bifidobacterium tibiigranuli]MCH4274870.1 hypothetical protein [Bifidobacterium tibiigranuli]MCI1792411.1 hypothetical protein [Bifidobacterium tibiigranuli]